MTVQNVFMRLLLKDPLDRYQTAEQVILDLREAAGLSPLEESIAIRSSYLEAAEFVGREAEMEMLRDALDNTLENAGSSWLIGGESGVGKSRLTEELRIRALVKGCLVYTGRATKEDGSTYRLWRDILKALVIQVDVSPTEAALLQSFVPDIQQVVNLPELPEITLQPEELQKQQLNIIEALLRRQTRPILIILEDLHWVGEGLRTLQHINRFVNQTSIMVIGNYRDDERPQLPSSLPQMQTIKLKRFEDNAIIALSSAMIGPEIGQHPEIIDLLKRETEGNVFFIVQVLQALANNAGQLSDIDITNLPEQVFAGGIDDVIKRRLAHLPPNTIPILKLAAIIGRDVDLDIMEYLVDSAQLQRWLNICHVAHVLEVNGQQWSFSHDKIRDYVSREMIPDDECQQLHRQVAGAIETVYASRITFWYTRLAHHWEEGQRFGKAIEYLEKNAQLALDHFENQDALEYLERVEALTEKFMAESNSTGVVNIARWERMAGEAKYALRVLDESSDHFENALQVINISERAHPRREHYLEAARNHELLVPIYLYSGDWDRAVATMQEAAEIYQHLNQTAKYVQIMAGIPWIYHLRGYFTEATLQFDENIKVGTEDNLPFLIHFSYLGKAIAACRIGTENHLEEAESLVRLVLYYVRTHTSATTLIKMMTYSIATIVLLRRGKADEALTYMERAIDFVGKTANNSYLASAGYIALADAHLSHWENQQNNQKEVLKSYKRQTRKAMNLLHQFAQIVPIARPRAWVYQAWLHNLNGKPDKAEQTIAMGISEAMNHDMRYDEALAYAVFGSILSDDRAEREMALEHALDIFQLLGAEWDYRRLQNRLARGS